MLCHISCLIMSLQKGFSEYLLDKKTKFTGHIQIHWSHSHSVREYIGLNNSFFCFGKTDEEM